VIEQSRDSEPSGGPRGGALVGCLSTALTTVACLLTALTAAEPPLHASPPLRLAAEPGTVRLAPASARISPGETTEVVVWLESAEDYYGIDVRIGFDPDVVDVPDGRVTPVWDLFNASSHWIVRNHVYGEQGEIWYAVTNHNPAAPFDGTGRICRINFRGVSTGTTTLAVHYARGSTNLGQSLEPARAGAEIIVGPKEPELCLVELIPTSVQAGTAGLPLTAQGRGFANGAVLRWGDAERATTFVSSTTLTAEVGTDDLAEAGVISVTVVNPGPAGAPSNALPFTVTNPAPSIDSLEPVSAPVGTPGLTLHVAGSGFVRDATVLWEGQPRATTLVSNTLVTAELLPGDLAAKQTVHVSVSNPPPGGGASNEVVFEVTEFAPAPSAHALFLPYVASDP